ncbi:MULTISPECIES: FxsA family protein [Symbiopectobacterium]|uniref:FxsA family protein n=1 Tax=Symbiopectobacterium TaxID=801 RepID=UPI001A2DEA95|nr:MULTISPECIES: FxsA family protein [Symbiopectobacterium]MBG6248205.1 membrane protein FxsA [Candidatus Symbiopectobacterium sp. PLON1]MBT9430901.1 membrane protein FxsA [Candidatus Symbiopectobacterium endolongispinus]
MRWLPLFLLFLFAYIEISLFIRVAEVLGVAVTLLLVVFTSCIGVSLVRNQGVKTFIQMQQKIAAGESPAAEMVKSVSLVLAGFLLLLPGFFTDFLGLLLLLPSVQKRLTVKLMPHLHIWRSAGTTSSGSNGNTFNGEFYRKDDDRKNLEHKDDQDK